MGRRRSRLVLMGCAWVVACCLSAGLRASDWEPRKDVGVAAVDRQTGEIAWEAWEEGDVPDEAPQPVKQAVKDLLAKWEWSPGPGYGYVPFPLQLADGQIVRYVYDRAADRRFLTLARGTVKRPGEDMARFSYPNEPTWHTHGGQMLYIVSMGYLYALAALRGDPPDDEAWRPKWTRDLVVTPPGEVRKPPRIMRWTLRADDAGLWISDDHQIRRFSQDGKLGFVHTFKDPWPLGIDGFGAPLEFGERHIYYRRGRGVIAIDRETGREAWRTLTARSPYPSQVVETEGDLVLIQVGSDAPTTIKGALLGDEHPLRQLGPNTPQQRVAAAMLLKSYGDGYPRAALRQWMARVAKRAPDDAARQAVAILEKLLADWPATRDRQRLIDACVDALTANVGLANVFATPATQRRLTWCLLQELIYGEPPDGYSRLGTNYAYHTWDERPLPLSAARRRALARHCRQVIAEGRKGESAFAASVLLSHPVGWDSLSDAELQRLFLSDHPSVWRWTGVALAKNGRRERLVELARRRPDGDHLDVIFILGSRMPKAPSPAERRFWLDCGRRMPGSVAYVLRSSWPGEIPLVYREPIRAYLAKEIEKPTVLVNCQKEYELVAALQVLHRWNKPEDTPLLLSYLRHPCQSSNGSYSVRQRVKLYLEQRGVELPAGVVYRREPDGNAP